MGNLFSWLGGHATPRDEAASAARARKHRQAKPNRKDRDAQRFADSGYCPAGRWHTGRCRGH